MELVGATQTNVSLTLNCIQTQQWVQSTVKTIIREGEEGILPAKNQKIIWDKATKFAKEFTSWWNPWNYTFMYWKLIHLHQNPLWFYTYRQYHCRYRWPLKCLSLQFYQNYRMRCLLFSSCHNSSIAAIQLCNVSIPVTYPCWDEPHFGEKAVATWWPASIAERNSRQWTKGSDHCPSWHRRNALCPRKSEGRWGTSLVGYLILMVSHSD